jgi:glutathione peroxidase
MTMLASRMRFICTLALSMVASVACQAAEPAMAPAPKPSPASAATAAPAQATIDVVMPDIGGQPFDFKAQRGKVVVVVNVASECGYTPQYAELQQLHQRYADKGVIVVGVPSNDFGGQEPNDGAAILAFAQKEYGVSFPLLSKVHATGPDISPLYRHLTTLPGTLAGPVKWNFAKFIVGKDGRVQQRFDSGVSPLDSKMIAAIDQALQG